MADQLRKDAADWLVRTIQRPVDERSLEDMRKFVRDVKQAADDLVYQEAMSRLAPFGVVR